MLDRFVDGDVARISPETPVPVFVSGRHRLFPGGAANVARNVAALGSSCTVVGLVGDDDAGRELGRILGELPRVRTSLIGVADRPTTEKTRFVARGRHMLRVDRETTSPAGGDLEDLLIAAVERFLPENDILVLSDYAKGVLTDRVVQESIVLARTSGKLVVVDPKSPSLQRYNGASIATPNAAEIRTATGIDPKDDVSAAAAGRAVLRQTEFDAVLITRGERGMTLVRRAAGPVHIEGTAREVYDVVGAGDTVVAAFSVALATGASLEAAARIGNAAAGIVVGKRETAAVSSGELTLELERLSRGSAPPDAASLLTLDAVATYAAARRTEGKTVGFTNGVFDILHAGHISMLQSSRSACDCLIVGLNSDESVRRLKGPSRPINREFDRSIVLGALAAVDAIVIFDADTPIELIEAIRPDVLIKGADYTLETVVGASFVRSYGGRVMLAPLIEGTSSTATLTRAAAMATR